MKNLIRWGLVGATAMALLVPGRASAQTFLNGTYYGGSNFATGFEVVLAYKGYDAGAGGHVLELAIKNIGYGGEFAGVFKGIGLANVPVAPPDGTGPTIIGGSYSTDPSNVWTFHGTQGSVNGDGLNEVIWAFYATSPAPFNGLDFTESGTFRFVLDTWDEAWTSQIGVAVHAIGYNERCSTKFGVWDAGRDKKATDGNDWPMGSREYDPDCVPVPEPGTNALLAIGLFGMAFVAVRRKSLPELLGRA